MSENITHTAVTDDCRLLCLHSPDICEAFKECLRAHHNVARLGDMTFRFTWRFRTARPLTLPRPIWLQQSSPTAVSSSR